MLVMSNYRIEYGSHIMATGRVPIKKKDFELGEKSINHHLNKI